MIEKIRGWIFKIRKKLCVHDWMEITYSPVGYSKFRCAKCGKVIYIRHK